LLSKLNLNNSLVGNADKPAQVQFLIYFSGCCCAYAEISKPEYSGPNGRILPGQKMKIPWHLFRIC